MEAAELRLQLRFTVLEPGALTPVELTFSAGLFPVVLAEDHNVLVPAEGVNVVPPIAAATPTTRSPLALGTVRATVPPAPAVTALDRTGFTWSTPVKLMARATTFCLPLRVTWTVASAVLGFSRYHMLTSLAWPLPELGSMRINDCPS